jgi:alpha-tubulin N-acetyltransferase 1
LINNPDQKLYLYWEFDSPHNKSKLLGYVRVGRKSLYLYDKNQAAYEGEFVCILDVYVHQVSLSYKKIDNIKFKAHQRRGIGSKLFNFIMQMENTHPEMIALDNPSVALLGFLAKVYGLNQPVWQNTNFVVFQQLFDLSKGGGEFIL